MADEAVIETASPATMPGAAPEQAVAIQGARPPATAAKTGEILPPRRRKKRVVLPLILLAGLGGGGYEGYRWFVEGRFLVSTDDAYVKADTSILAAKVAGYVALVPVADNAVVKKGQVLARIDAGDYENAVEAAVARIATQDATVARIGRQVAAGAATVDQAKAQLLSAEAEATRTATEFDRAEALMRSSYGTQQRLDQARTDRDRASASVASAAAAVTSAESAIDVLRAQKVEAEKVGGELQTVTRHGRTQPRLHRCESAVRRHGRQQVGRAWAVCAARDPADGAGAARQRLCRGELQGDAGRPAEARSARDHPAGRLWRP